MGWKHTRTKVMNLKGRSDYSAPTLLKARNKAPQNSLLSRQAEEAQG